MSGVDVLATAVFAAYSRNSGNPPECHFDRNAAEQWMAQALKECGVVELIEAVSDVYGAEANARKSSCSPDCMSCRIQRAVVAVKGEAT